MATHRRRRTLVLRAEDVVDDHTLHPGTIVWLAEPALRADELEDGALFFPPTPASGVRSWDTGPVAR